MSYICVWYSRIYRKCLFWFIIKNYVCHFLKVEGKPGQSVTSCAFLWCYLWMWKDPGPSVHSWLALLVGVQRSISDSWDQTLLSPPPVPSTSWITHRYAGIYRQPWKDLPYVLCHCSAHSSVCQQFRWLGWTQIYWQHQKSAGAHLVRHLVKGDGADNTSQSWNVPGSLNLGCFQFSRLPDKVVTDSVLLFFVSPKTFNVVSTVRLVNILPKALQKSRVRWFV